MTGFVVNSKRDAIGAQVRISTPAGKQFATVTASSSPQSRNDKRLHFGLDGATSILEIGIRWPSGTCEVVRDADRIITITEQSK